MNENRTPDQLANGIKEFQENLEQELGTKDEQPKLIKSGPMKGRPMPDKQLLQDFIDEFNGIKKPEPYQVIYGTPRYEAALVTLEPTTPFFVYYNNIPIETTPANIEAMGEKLEATLRTEADKIIKYLTENKIEIRPVNDKDLIANKHAPSKTPPRTKSRAERRGAQMTVMRGGRKRGRGSNITPSKKKRKR